MKYKVVELEAVSFSGEVVLFGVFPFPQVFSHLGFPESNVFL
jgi:hypothetical protein